MQRTIHVRRMRLSRLSSFVAALLAAGLVGNGAAYAQNAGGATVTPVGNGTVAASALPANAGAGSASVAASGTLVRGTAGALAPPPANATPGQVVVGGKVPDEATKAAVLQKLRDTYGAANVVDHIEVGDVATPPNWSANVQKLLGAQLKQISKGQLKINGTQIEMKGEVHNEAQRQQIASDMANTLNPTYTIRNGLRVSASEQGLLDQTLANRTIEFETGSATLTPQGKQILDQMAAALAKLQNRTVDIIGHTDNSGNRTSNIALSQARADAVKGYLITKGIAPQQMTTTGVGPDQPIAPNDTADGRARNRRIEFRVGQ
ncbi:OmpA family protein [Burkholderia multivorans]|uniref:OmpA family protein n=1 Tax=Burkholderia multivorans TaxID=87883 RepID=UPI002019B8DF|nr:OmpA family protein [Burkholderia multivorans]MCO1383263.1 OmpA family protein [Burkholderia multivorans]MCO1403673.1 OmpA family protein [Burkholderia multivorans]UQO77826.1 OmpA family protein [Burkholderia multivorans]